MTSLQFCDLVALNNVDNELFNVICGRQFRALWFTYHILVERWRRQGADKDEIDERQKYWQRRLDVEESTAAFLDAIATLIQDAPQITLQLYIAIVRGVPENIG